MQNLGYVLEGKLGFKPEQPALDSIFFVLFGVRVLPCNSGWPRTQDRNASVSCVLGWQALEFLPAFFFSLLPSFLLSLSPSLSSPFKIILHVYRWCVCVTYTCLDHLGLELEIVVSHHVGTGN